MRLPALTAPDPDGMHWALIRAYVLARAERAQAELAAQAAPVPFLDKWPAPGDDWRYGNAAVMPSRVRPYAPEATP